MQARLTGAGHMLHISPALRSVAGPAGDWRWWVLDQDGCRVGESVLMGNRPLYEVPTESEMQEAYGCPSNASAPAGGTSSRLTTSSGQVK